MRLVAASSIVCAAVLTSVAPAASRVEGECGSRIVTIHFWPHGHPAIPSIRAPSYPRPHAEVYGSPLPQYPAAVEIAFASLLRISLSACDRRPETTTFRRVPMRTIGIASIVECNVRFGAVVQLRKRPRRATLRVLDERETLLVTARFGAQDGTLALSTRHCKRRPPPA